MKSDISANTIKQPAREIKVCRKADVIVVGGGPGGIGAAAAAARNGADTVLVERYGYLGGMLTGGYVCLFPGMHDGTKEVQIRGICEEWLDRLEAKDKDSVFRAKREDIGSTDEKIVKKYSGMSLREGKVMYTPIADPEVSKCVLNEMMEESKVKMYLHSWGTETVVDKNRVQGVIFESKSGRQAILGQVVIDATGDGDLFPSAGAEFDATPDPALRNSKLALVFQIANVDWKKLEDFRKADASKYDFMVREIGFLGGFSSWSRNRLIDNVVNFSQYLSGYSAINVEDLTQVEINSRKAILITYEFLKANMPGFEKSYIQITAPQIGTRGSRRLIGSYILTWNDCRSGKIFDDTIAVFPEIRHNLSDENPHVHIPYRCLIPREVDGLLVAGRNFSSDNRANAGYNLIPHAVAMGEAAGTAAALAVKSGVNVRDVEFSALRAALLKQGVLLPDTSKAPAKAAAAKTPVKAGAKAASSGAEAESY